MVESRNAGAPAPELPPRRSCIPPFGRRLLLGLQALVERARDRRLLARLDDRMLRDVGLDRRTVERGGTTWSWPLR
jgi:uncharacterized protein YjiS (DUF1127 family)